jgi:3-mercaptopyruvate sulfurtransferase SseA
MAVTWGFNKVFYFAGGYPAWSFAGYPKEEAQQHL